MNPALHVSLGATHPVKLILLLDGRVAFQRIGQVNGALFDSTATFFADSFCFQADGQTEDYAYNTGYHYKQLPLMKQWLIGQNLPSP